ncbi:SDR family NAD(P)-dependent oxidoreductase [Streptococcus mutans]|uniref:SDR family NAD(P)-dependent oxidoreductase n=1 Tax=Streptococcus mutans TaxID=1309 RepID=UPI0038BBCA54
MTNTYQIDYLEASQDGRYPLFYQKNIFLNKQIKLTKYLQVDNEYIEKIEQELEPINDLCSMNSIIEFLKESKNIEIFSFTYNNNLIGMLCFLNQSPKYVNKNEKANQLICTLISKKVEFKDQLSFMREAIFNYYSLETSVKKIYEIFDTHKGQMNNPESHFETNIVGRVVNYRITDAIKITDGMVVCIALSSKWNMEQYIYKGNRIKEYLTSTYEVDVSKSITENGISKFKIEDILTMNKIEIDKVDINKIMSGKIDQLVEFCTVNSGIQQGNLRERVQSAKREYKEIVPININNNGEIIYFIHPLSGEVSSYKYLADNSEKNFKVIGIKNINTKYSTMEEIVEHYYNIIKKIQPNGPYNVGGYSFGGTIAYELIHKMVKMDDRVNKLILIDPIVVNSKEIQKVFTISDYDNLLLNGNYLLLKNKTEGTMKSGIHVDAGITEDILLDEMCNQIYKQIPSLSLDYMRTQIIFMSKIHKNNLQILSEYRAIPLRKIENFNVLVFKTSQGQISSDRMLTPPYLMKLEQEYGDSNICTAPWSHLLSNNKCDTVKIEASHMDILQNRGSVAEISEYLSRYFPSKTECNESDIAIVGMSGVFPDASNINELWKNLQYGICSISEESIERKLNIQQYYNPKPRNKRSTYSKKGGFVNTNIEFNALDYRISPKEFEQFDISEKIFIKEVINTIESSGKYQLSDIKGKKWGIFSSLKGDGFVKKILEDSTYYHSTDSKINGFIANFLDIHGPVLSVDTACSSGLSALCTACDNLYLGNCDAAIVGAGNVYSTPNAFIGSSQSLILSKQDSCLPFTEGADGTQMGESVCALLLKKRKKAEDDGDTIYGLIRGWGINQDGQTNGLTAPNGLAQQELIKSIYNKFSLKASNLLYIEAHGTGTELGDKIEFDSLKTSIGSMTNLQNYCYLGSLKANIGHTFLASGLVSVIKGIKMLQNRKIPVQLHSNRKFFNTEQSPFKFADSTIDDIKKEKNLVGISSFGATGTNAHVVLENYPKQKEQVINDEKSNIKKISDSSQINHDIIKSESRDKKIIKSFYQEQWNYSPVIYKNSVQTRQPVMFLVDSIKEKRVIEEKFTSDNTCYTREDFYKNYDDLKHRISNFKNICIFWNQIHDTLIEEYKIFFDLFKMFNKNLSLINKVYLFGDINSIESRALLRSLDTVRINSKKRFSMKIIELIDDFEFMDKLNLLTEEMILDGHYIRYKDGNRESLELKYLGDDLTQFKPSNSKLKEGGTYVIFGGLGKIGFSLCKYLVNTYGINVVIVGRSKINSYILNKIKKLSSDAQYYQADVSSYSDLINLRTKLQSSVEGINGIFNLSGTVVEKNINDKTYKEFEDVISCKVMGTKLIYEIFSFLRLDFICNFSSTSAFLGDFSMFDYAISNRFQFEFNQLPNQEVPIFNICWPLWRNSGLTLGEEKNQLYLRSTNQKELEFNDGFQCMESIISNSYENIIVIATDRKNSNQLLSLYQSLNDINVNTNVHTTTTLEKLNEREIVSDVVFKAISKLQGISYDLIDGNKYLGDFGIDSIVIFDLIHIIGDNLSIKLDVVDFVQCQTLFEIIDVILSKKIEIRLEYYNSSSIEGTKGEELDIGYVLREIVSNTQKIPLESLNMSTYIGDYGIDSIAIMDIVTDLELKLGVSLKAEEFIQCQTLESFKEILKNTYSKQKERIDNPVHVLHRLKSIVNFESVKDI